MKNWSKKIASVALATLFIGFSSGQCRETNWDSQEIEVSQAVTLPLYNCAKECNLIFDFMRNSHLLHDVENLCNVSSKDNIMNNFFGLFARKPFFVTVEEIKNLGEPETTNEDTKPNNETVPFRKLFFQLDGKLMMLVQAEQNFGASKKDPKLTKLKTKLEAMLVPKTRESLNEILKEISEYNDTEYQNIIDSQNLFIATSYDFFHLSTVLRTINDNKQKQELINKIHEHLLTNYKKFITQNEAALQRIEQIANNGFIIKAQNCVNYEGERICVGETIERPIKTLSELMEDLKVSETQNEDISKVIAVASDVLKNEQCSEANEELNKNCDEFNKDYQSAKEAVNEAYNEIKPVVKDAYSEIKPIVKDAYCEVKAATNEASSGFKNTVKEAYAKVKNNIKKLFKKKD